MINIELAMRSDRILKSLTGLSVVKFKELVNYFEIIIKEESAKSVKSDKDRKRAIGGGKKHTLCDAEAKLFYILFY